jgi:hypothetical protein
VTAKGLIEIPSTTYRRTNQQARRHVFGRVMAIVLAITLVSPIAAVRAAGTGEWIGTWAASPQPV